MVVLSRNKIVLLLLFLTVVVAGGWLVKNSLNKRSNLSKTALETDFSKKENHIKTQEVTGDVGLSCLADFTKINYGKVEIANGIFLKSWAPCTVIDAKKQNITVNLPLLIESDQLLHTGFIFGVEVKNKPYEFSQLAVKSYLSKVIDLYSPKSKQVAIRAVAGGGSDKILLYNNPYPGIYAATGLDRDLDAFTKSLNVNLLPKVDYIDNFFFAYKIAVIQ